MIHPCHLGLGSPFSTRLEILLRGCGTEGPAGSRIELRDSCTVSGCFHVAIAGRYHAMPPLRSAPIGPVPTATIHLRAPSSLRSRNAAFRTTCLQCGFRANYSVLCNTVLGRSARLVLSIDIGMCEMVWSTPRKPNHRHPRGNTSCISCVVISFPLCKPGENALFLAWPSRFQEVVQRIVDCAVKDFQINCILPGLVWALEKPGITPQNSQ